VLPASLLPSDVRDGRRRAQGNGDVVRERKHSTSLVVFFMGLHLWAKNTQGRRGGFFFFFLRTRGGFWVLGK
jgi:hypothetical protein